MATASITREEAKKLYEFCKTNKVDEFFFAKDQGAYFGATTGSQKNNDFSNSIHYVKGCNPTLNDEWYDYAWAKFGGDDFGVHLSTTWLEAFFNDESYSNKRTFGIQINKRSVSLIR